MSEYFGRWRCKRLGEVVLLSILILFSSRALAWKLVLQNVSDGYRACSWQDNGNGTSTLRLTIDFKRGYGNTGEYPFRSRGILIYTYDKNGNLNPSSKAATAVAINGESYRGVYPGDGYVMYYGHSTQWVKDEAFSADIGIVIDNSYVIDWPALSVRAGIFTEGDDVGEIKGAAYLNRFGTDASCKMVDPVVPPPPNINISVTAPDWNLGELLRGENEKTFTGGADQLCFTYIGTAVDGKKFIVNASSTNGIVGNRYRLKNVNDASQLVPYSVMLNSGTSTVSLPNATNTALSFDSAGRTCFVPTFKTTVDPNVTEGDYSDVLTFTVVTNS